MDLLEQIQPYIFKSILIQKAAHIDLYTLGIFRHNLIKHSARRLHGAGFFLTLYPFYDTIIYHHAPRQIGENMNSQEIMQLLEERRTYRRFDESRQIPDEVVVDMKRAA